MIEEVHKDAALQEIITALEEGKAALSGFSYVTGVLWYDGLLVVSASSPWIPMLLKEF